jgi:hypothetical protein
MYNFDTNENEIRKHKNDEVSLNNIIHMRISENKGRDIND